MVLPLRVVTEEKHTKKPMLTANEVLSGERSGAAFSTSTDESQSSDRHDWAT